MTEVFCRRVVLQSQNHSTIHTLYYWSTLVHRLTPLEGRSSPWNFKVHMPNLGARGVRGVSPRVMSAAGKFFFGILVGDTQKVHMPHTCPPQAPLNRAHMPREKVHMPTHAQGGACVGMCTNSSPGCLLVVPQSLCAQQQGESAEFGTFPTSPLPCLIV